MILVIRKGYKLEGATIHERLLNEYTNEYGFNLRTNESRDIIKVNLKPRSIVKRGLKGGKK